MKNSRAALLAQQRQLLLAASTLQRAQLGLDLRTMGARGADLRRALQPWLAWRALLLSLLPLAAAAALRRAPPGAKLARGIVLWRALLALRRWLRGRTTPSQPRASGPAGGG